MLTALLLMCVCKFLPTPLAWHFHQLPAGVQGLSAVSAITAEVAGSLLMLSPVRHHRLVAFYLHVRRSPGCIAVVIITTTAMVDVDSSCQFSADSQPKSVGLV